MTVEAAEDHPRVVRSWHRLYQQRGSRHVLPLTAVVVCFTASRVGFWLAGVRFNLAPLTEGSEQVLAVRLLKHQLFTSVWYLHSQPPLFNLYCGLIVHLPGGLQRTVAWVTFMVIGLVIAIALYLLLVELRVSPALALLITVVVVVSPSEILYENWLFYAYPSAAVLVLGALFGARYLHTQKWAYGFGFFASICALALLDSLYQPFWVLGVLLLMAFMARNRIRQLVTVAAIPVLVLTGWVVKDAIQFGTYSTSSWIGMTLANMTLVPAARSGQLQELVREHKLDRLALVGPWKPVPDYTPKYVPDHRTGVAALDERRGNISAANYNNIVYVQVSSLLLSDDLRYIELEPGTYLNNVGISAAVWLTPSDQYPFVYQNWLKIQPWVDGFDKTIGWQPHEAPAATTALGAVLGRAPAAAQISYSTVLVYSLAIFGAPVLLLIRRRRLGRNMIGMVVFLWGTVTYAFATSSFLDIAENNRLRFELGPIPLVLAVVVALWSIEPMLSDRHVSSRWWRWFGLTTSTETNAPVAASEDGKRNGFSES